MSHSNAMRRYHVKGVDFKTIAATKIFTTENGTERFHPLFVIFEVTSASVVISVATASIGTNASTYNNILVASALTGLSAANKMLQSILGATAMDSVASNTDVYVNVSVGASATTCTGNVSVIGYYD